MVVYRQLKSDLETLEPVKILKESMDAIKLVARSAKESWLELVFEFEKSAPYKLLGIRIMRLAEPPDLNAPTTPITEAEMLKEIETFMDEISIKDEFSGVVLLAKGEKPIFQKAYGLASKEYNIPNRVDTRFNLGSINKFLTRIVIEQLEGKGKLRFEDPIGKYLPDYPNKEAAEKVTIRHLLDMTSGIGDFFGERYQSTPKDRIRTLSDYLLLFGDEPLLFEPGKNRQYSNGGYIVLGLIIEKVSGQTYFDYVRDNIYKIAGMENTTHLEADVPAENVASGYTNNWDENDHPGEPRRNNIYTRPARGSSAGGGYSTADDLLKLVVALKKNELSAPKTSEEINKAGIAIAGGAPGINAYVETDPEKGYVIIVLSNYDPPVVDKVARKINSFLERLK
jgi:CubicO group peptidase (beta-lactamase class C family)